MEDMPFISIPLHGKRGEGKFTLVDGDYDGEYFNQYRWAILPSGYVAAYGHYDNITYENTGLLKERKQPFIYLHRLASSPPAGMWVRHKDSNKLNNRSCNLEWITPKQSALERAKPRRKQAIPQPV